jgi:hypothetical protein
MSQNRKHETSESQDEDATMRTCRLETSSGILLGYVTLRRDEIPTVFRYQDRLFLQGAKRVFTEMESIVELDKLRPPA